MAARCRRMVFWDILGTLSNEGGIRSRYRSHAGAAASGSREILTSHVRSIDTLARPISYAEAAVPAATLDELRSELAGLLGI